MIVQRGRSDQADATEAVAACTEGWSHAPELLVAFCSTRQDAAEVQRTLARKWPGVPIVGCTTSGEHLDGTHGRHSLVLAGLAETGISWGTGRIDQISNATEATVQQVVSDARARLGWTDESIDPDTHVCLLFIDGLRGREESVSAWLADALDGVPLAGGSAGDDLEFAQTLVFDEHGAWTDAATLLFARSETAGPIRVLKHQHFVTTPASLVVTAADGRTVREFDGYPALDAYARTLGLTPAEVTGDVTFLNPVVFACNGELYVRSIQSINDDGSITFYCAVEEGMVLEIGGHNDMAAALSADVESLEPAEFILGFNCILRALEATGSDQHGALGSVLNRRCEHMIGFDTYGEQLNGLHINQTLVAVAFGTRPTAGGAR